MGRYQFTTQSDDCKNVFTALYPGGIQGRAVLLILQQQQWIYHQKLKLMFICFFKTHP